MRLYAIACRFIPRQGDKAIEGMAICSDPDTPVTFIYPNGTPYLLPEIWNYSLQHYRPWACIEH